MNKKLKGGRQCEHCLYYEVFSTEEGSYPGECEFFGDEIPKKFQNKEGDGCVVPGKKLRRMDERISRELKKNAEAWAKAIEAEIDEEGKKR